MMAQTGDYEEYGDQYEWGSDFTGHAHAEEPSGAMHPDGSPVPTPAPGSTDLGHGKAEVMELGHSISPNPSVHRERTRGSDLSRDAGPDNRRDPAFAAKSLPGEKRSSELCPQGAKDSVSALVTGAAARATPALESAQPPPGLLTSSGLQPNTSHPDPPIDPQSGLAREILMCLVPGRPRP